jgi:hypothetical protein
MRRFMLCDNLTYMFETTKIVIWKVKPYNLVEGYHSFVGI